VRRRTGRMTTPCPATSTSFDDAIQIAVLDTTLTAPPSSPVDGERHIIASGASGAWAGQGDAVATWETNAWRFLAPKTGWCVWSIADDTLLVFDGSAWAPVTTGSSTLDNAPYFGVNATVTGSNLLTVRSNDALLNAIDATDGGTGDVRLQLSKSATGNTSSVVFSDAFSGRAEFGLTGDDDFHLKVSADGSTWRDALKFDRTTGRVSFPSGGAREAVTANRTYYVRTDGSDSNDGLSNTSGGAFLTIQKAVDAVAGLDIAGFNVTIQIADGTYTGAVTLKNVVGFSAAGNLVIQGNNTNPANVLVNVSSAYAFLADGISTIWDIKDLKVQNSGGYGMSARSGARVRFGNINFGACTGAAHIQTSGPGSTVTALSNYAVSGGGTAHFEVTYGAQFVSPTFTVTITNTPSFSLAWAFLSVLGSAQVHGMTFSGSATGSRYSINNGSVLFTNGAGTSYLPGERVWYRDEFRDITLWALCLTRGCGCRSVWVI